VVWGGDYNRDKYNIRGEGEFLTRATPDTFANDQLSVFADDEITLADNLWFTLGGRLNYNELTHFDWAGRGALVWEIRPEHFIRAAVSRSFRTPIMHEEFADLVKTGPNYRYKGNDSMDNEELIAYELGYRGRLAKDLELNIEGFLNKDKDLIGLVTDPGVYNQVHQNAHNVKTYGIETCPQLRASNR
jgi:iron complex outermembrane receptor protein